MHRIAFFVTHIKNNIYLYLIILFFGWIFFYTFDYTTLYSWDEAWYGTIAREILTTGDWRTLHFIGQPFYDHPPMGFWIMAVFYKLFGISEFSTRLHSVLAGLGSLILIYKLCEEFLGKKIVGFVAAIILGTSVWYVLRVRSGNLDSLFVFFYIATIYFAFKSTKSFRWFPLCAFLYGSLVMTKTLVGVPAGVIIAWVLFPYIFKSRWNIMYFLLGSAIFSVMVFPWYNYHLTYSSGFYDQHFVKVAARNREVSLDLIKELKWELPLFYLHMGVRKWYYLWEIGIGILSLKIVFDFILTIWKKSKKKKEQLLFIHKESAVLLWNVVVLYPFLTTDLTEIWHLIPVYPPLAIVTAYSMYLLFTWAITILRRFKLPYISPLVKSDLIGFLFLVPFLFFAGWQIKNFYVEVFPESRYVVDEVDILKKAKKYNKTVYIDRDYVPIAVFYSEQIIKEHTRESDDVKTIQTVFDNASDYVLVIKNSTVERYIEAGNTPKIHEKNNSFSIITEK